MPTPITDQQLQVLMAPLNPDRVSAKQGMSYLEAWDVKATLIRLFGFGGFSADLIESEIIREEQVAQVRDPNKINWVVTAKAVVRLTIHQTGATYTEAAIAGSKQPDYTECADMAIKSAESDALKRAAIYLGTQFGLSLYDNGSTRDVIKRVFAVDQTWPPVAQPPQAGPQDSAAGQQGEGPRVLPATGTEEQRAAGNAANQALLDRALRMDGDRQQQNDPALDAAVDTVGRGLGATPEDEVPMALAGDTDR